MTNELSHSFLRFFFSCQLCVPFLVPFDSFASNIEYRVDNNGGKVSLDVKQQTFAEIVSSVTKQTGYEISYQEDIGDLVVSGRFVDLEITDLINRVLRSQNVFLVVSPSQKQITVKTVGINGGNTKKNDGVLQVAEVPKAILNTPPAGTGAKSTTDLNRKRTEQQTQTSKNWDEQEKIMNLEGKSSKKSSGSKSDIVEELPGGGIYEQIKKKQAPLSNN